MPLWLRVLQGVTGDEGLTIEVRDFHGFTYDVIARHTLTSAVTAARGRYERTFRFGPAATPQSILDDIFFAHNLTSSSKIA